ncbi:MAG TPA: PaaI family thioesterase [Sphingomonas sp.]|jgi:uncharacterized protein (TIGR00369 family)|nr:PaaI family thioesterase [Sphingomonas sp.]
MSEFGSPYARTMGFTTSREDGLIVTMPPSDGVMGRPGFLHGGAMAGLLDFTAWVTLFDALEDGATIKPISISTDFMRGGKPEPLHARATIVRLGRRIANVSVAAWQDDESKPVAAANLKFLIER